MARSRRYRRRRQREREAVRFLKSILPAAGVRRLRAENSSTAEIAIAVWSAIRPRAGLRLTCDHRNRVRWTMALYPQLVVRSPGMFVDRTMSEEP